MCGIFGVWQLNGEEVCRDRVRVCRDTIAHRGPDDCGEYVYGNVGLGHRRLSIIDLSPNGRQPIANETGDVRVIFNGEIYNFIQLRSELERLGHRFASNTDSEVIVHGYEEWGEDCFERFNGMFAIGIWDARTQRMLLARDPIGKKPLYYYYEPGVRLIYASTLKPIMSWPSFPRVVDEDSVCEYLKFGSVPASRSIFRNTYKVLPGQQIVLENNGTMRKRLYWDLVNDSTSVSSTPPSKTNEYVEEFHELLLDAVKIRMIADVPLGAFLSGGLDSSLIVALMANVCRDRVRTYTMGFTVAREDESPYARAVAKALGVQNKVMVMTSSDMFNYMPEIVSYYDEPMADFSLFPTLAVSKLARENVSVVLSGDGGDEVFGGYNGYVTASLAQYYYRCVPGFLRNGIAGLLGIIPQDRFRTLAIQSRASDIFRFIGMYHRIDRRLDIRDMVARRIELKAPEDDVANILNSYSGLSVVEKYLLYDTTHNMVDAILHKVDRGSMAHALEVRCPLLDKRVVKFAFSLPLRMKVRGFQKKYIIRKLLSRYIPDHLIDRPKMGFGPPLREWFQGPLRPMVNELLSRERIEHRGFLCPDQMETLLRRHFSGENNHTWFIWAVLMLEMWYQKYVDPVPDVN